MLDNLQQYTVVLASNSPRRKELLQRMCIDFKVRPLLGLEETYPLHLKGEEIVKFVAKDKADAYLSVMEEGANDLIIAADTLVFLDGEVMGKPNDEKEAKEMLDKLSGRTHEVVTGVSVATRDRSETFADTTYVHFSLLSKEEIDYYVKQFLPFDKAGGYGIQEWLGHIAVDKFEGSYFNVMGLPTQKLYAVLKTF